MKLHIAIVSATLLTLIGCVSYTRNIDSDRSYSHFIDQKAITTKELRIYKRPEHQYLFSEYGLSAWRIYDDRFSKLIEILPAGTVLEITEARREYDRYGSSDYILGNYHSESFDRSLQFEFMLTAIERREEKLPFKVENTGYTTPVVQQVSKCQICES